MKFNFAQAAANDVDTFGDEGLFGPDVNGNFYYNTLEFGTNAGGTDEVVIMDGCGRSIPVCVEHLGELIVALTEVQRLATQFTLAQQLTAYVESGAEAYVDNFQVKHDIESIQEIAQRSNYF